MLGFSIFDALGKKIGAHVTPENSLSVSIGNPILLDSNQPSKLRFLSGLLGTTGLDSGSTAMNVDGSTTPVEFQLLSNPDYDIRVTKILLYIQDSTISHPGYGAVGALANGVTLKVEEFGVTSTILPSVKTMADAIQQTLVEAPFGDSAKAFELEQVVGTDDALVLPMDIGAIIPGGIRIGRGTKDRIVFTVNDNLTGLTAHTLRVVGFRHYP